MASNIGSWRLVCIWDTFLELYTVKQKHEHQLQLFLLIEVSWFRMTVHLNLQSTNDRILTKLFYTNLKQKNKKTKTL